MIVLNELACATRKDMRAKHRIIFETRVACSPERQWPDRPPSRAAARSGTALNPYKQVIFSTSA
jgi:hypothetical protein